MTTTHKAKAVWMDGKMVPFEQATIHILTPALHYGMAVFEGIRCYNATNGPAVFRLTPHIERLVDSAKVLGIREYQYSVTDLYKATLETIAENGFKECYIRPLIYQAHGPMGLNMDNSKPATAIAAWEWGSYLGDTGMEKGVRMMVSSFTRHHINATMTKAKVTGFYVNSTLAKTFALRAGFDEAIMLDPNGYVAECSGENLFLVRDGVIYTPPRATILEGITRDSLMILAKDLGYTVVEEPISRDQLYIADEVFVCGTAAECVPVREIDYRAIGNGSRGPVTHALQNLFFKTARGEGKRSSEWLDPIKT